jgi:hypothetical protein
MDYIEKVSFLLKKYLLPVMAAWMVISMVAGCSQMTPEPQAEPTETISTPTLQPAATAEPAVIPTATAQAEAGPVRQKIQLDATYNDVQKTMQVREVIEYTNNSKAALPRLVLAIDINRYYLGFSLESVEVGEVSLTDQITLSDVRLEIPLPEPLESGQTISIVMVFSSVLPPIPEAVDGAKPQVFGYTQRQVNLVDWYPYIVPYQEDSGWQLHEPTYFGEYLVYDQIDFIVDLHISNSDQTWVVAASSPELNSPSSTGDFHYELSHARNFVFSFSPFYQVQRQIVGGVEILSYHFPVDRLAGEMAFNNTIEAYQLYSDLYGVLEQPSMSLVEADFLDGMEFQGLYFLSKGFYNLYDGTVKGYLTMIAVHETAHQWWYASVADDQEADPWLDEAFATYSERLYYEHFYPDLVDWWWAYRVTFYQPAGKIDQPVESYPGFTPYRNAVYLRGAQFLEAVRIKLGDEDFFALIKDYAQVNAGKIVSADDFLGRIQVVTGVDPYTEFENFLTNNAHSQ